MTRAVFAFCTCFALSVQAQPAVDPQARAEALFLEGAHHYDRGEFEPAIARFLEAHRLSQNPKLLFNIAQAYRLKGSSGCAQALEYYERAASEDAQLQNRAEVERRIGEMRRCKAEQAPAVAPQPELVAAPAPARPRRAWIAAPVLIGVVALILGVGLGVGLRSQPISWNLNDPR